MTPILGLDANTYNHEGLIISVYFPVTTIINRKLDVYLISLHIVHTCEYGPTS